MDVPHLSSLTWPAFRSLAASGRLVAILPLGAVEAHGPHLPLGTDIVIAEAMARAGGARLIARGFDAVILPTLPVAPAPFAAAFAGTIDIAAAATATTLEGIARSMARHGARAVVVANAHHDPAHVAAIRDVVAQLERDGTAVLLFPDLTRRRWATRLTEEFQSGACHAGRYETSVVLAAAPGTVDSRIAMGLPPNPASLVTAIEQGQRTFEEAGGSDAYFGSPGEATADEGRDIIERLGAIIEDAVIAALGTHASR
jgi:creatinine amidohydrolase